MLHAPCKLLAAASAVLLAACATPRAPGPGPDRPAGAGGGAPAASAAPALPALASRCEDWLAAQARGEGTLFRLDPAASRLRVYVFRGGRLAAMGHHHVLGLDRLQGQGFLPRQEQAGVAVELGFRLDELVVDRPEWRREAGGAFGTTPTEDDRAGTRTNLLRALEAARFPEVRLQSVSAAGAMPWITTRMAVQLHGQTRVLDLPLKVVPAADVQANANADEGAGAGAAMSPGALSVQGHLQLRQSDFGLQPFSVLGGLLAVQDDLLVAVDLLARPTRACLRPWADPAPAPAPAPVAG